MNYACTFFGHRDAPSSLYPNILSTIQELRLQHNVDTFFIGNEGSFDRMVQRALAQILPENPQIHCSIVLSRLPTNQEYPLPTVFPEGFERIPPRFAVYKRNQWMLHRSDFVVTYVRHSWGGAARFSELAAKQQKYIVAL